MKPNKFLVRNKKEVMTALKCIIRTYNDALRFYEKPSIAKRKTLEQYSDFYEFLTRIEK